MNWRPWPKTEMGGLARYVLPGAATELRMPYQPPALPQDPASRRALVEAIYTALRRSDITYRVEDYQPEPDRQRIRPPKEILDAPGVGTCLDLAALFCGICLGHNLLPLLIVLNDHAFAAVSLTHNRPESRSRTRTERALFEDGVLRADKVEDLMKLLDEAEGAFLPVECTGFSCSESLSAARPEGNGREQGFLPFERAISAAREHLTSADRRLSFAIDVAALHDSGYLPPPPLGEAEADVRVYSGATALRLDYRSKTAYILQYYGARFVGRDEEQEVVFDFIRGRGPLGGGSYLLVEAPGGIGKSAFMVSLVRRAQEGRWVGPAPHVVYFFVRRQGGQDTAEAFLQAVNSQLLARLGVSGGTPLTLTELRAQFTQLWDAVEKSASLEAPFVLLVDGLDEMSPAGSDGGDTIADLLPAAANPAIHIVVSSRPHPSAKERVGREHPLASAEVLALSHFDLKGIQQLLDESVAAEPAARGSMKIAAMPPTDANSVAQRVLALTRGEPLFARFVCEEVVKNGLEKLAELEKDPPRDAEDYFHRELAALRESAGGEESWQLLGTLCVARGRLSCEDLAGINKEPPRRIKPTLARLDRYLLGQERFEIMHTLLRDLVSGEFTSDELRGFTERILTWCEGFRAGGWPERTPQYVLDNFLGHLVEAGRIGAACDALDRSFFIRKRDSARSEGAFVADANHLLASLNRAGDKAGGGDATEIELARLKVAFLLLSLAGRFYWLGPRYIEFQAVFGSAHNAYYLCSAIERPDERAEALLLYLNARPAGGIEPGQVLAEALVAAAAHADANGDVGQLVRVADQAAQFKHDDLAERALKEAAAAADSFSVSQRAYALATIAGAWSRRSRTDLAESYAAKSVEAAASVASAGLRHVELMKAAVYFAGAGLPSRADEAVRRAEEAHPRQELHPGMAAQSIVLEAMAAAKAGRTEAAEGLLQQATEAIRGMEEGYISFVDDQPINTTNRKAWLLPMLAGVWLACGRPDQVPPLVNEMQDEQKRPEVRNSIAGLLAGEGHLRLTESLLAEIEDAEERRQLSEQAAVAAASEGNIDAAEALLQTVSPTSLARVAFHSAAAVWLKRQGRSEAKEHAERAAGWAVRVEPFEPNRVLRNKVRFFVRLASEVKKAGRREAARQFRAAAAHAAEAATGTLRPVILAELVPERSAADADEALPIFGRVQEAVSAIEDEEQRKRAAFMRDEIYAYRGWWEQLPEVDRGAPAFHLRLQALRDESSGEAFEKLVIELIATGAHSGVPLELALGVGDESFAGIGAVAMTSVWGNSLAWYRELVIRLASQKRLRAARDLVCAFTSDAEQWALTHSLLDAVHAGVDDVTAEWVDEVLRSGLPEVPTLSWVAERAAEKQAWGVALDAARRVLSLARSGPVGPVAAAACGRVLVEAGQEPGDGEAEEFAESSDQRSFRLGVELARGGSLDSLPSEGRAADHAELSAVALTLAAKGSFYFAGSLLRRLTDTSAEWPRARVVFSLAARRGALKESLSGIPSDSLGWPQTQAAVALAEAGLVEEAVELADSIVGEWTRPNALVAVFRTFLWADKLEPALRVASLDRTSLVAAVADRAAELGHLNLIAEAMDLLDQPTHRLRLNRSYGIALRNQGAAGTAQPAGAWVLPAFVTRRSDWFGHVASIAPLLAERFGAGFLESLGEFVQQTDKWLATT